MDMLTVQVTFFVKKKVGKGMFLMMYDARLGVRERETLAAMSSVMTGIEYLFISVINQLDARKSSLNLCTRRAPIGVMIPEAV